MSSQTGSQARILAPHLSRLHSDPIPTYAKPDPSGNNRPSTATQDLPCQYPTSYSSSSLSPGGTRKGSLRPLSPDLPERDAMYLFCNFSSYMRTPDEGAEGIGGEEFKDTQRLLEHARNLTAQTELNVRVLHLKYRFNNTSVIRRSPYMTGDYQLPMNYRDSLGRLRNPVPQPFSVLNDPVVKIDYLENGTFEPLPAPAVFSHIVNLGTQLGVPPPRVIVVSYVGSRVTENHIASLAHWGLTSSPPVHFFSPIETRIRERRSLDLALDHAIPISMYLSPASPSPRYSLSTPNSPIDRSAVSVVGCPSNDRPHSIDRKTSLSRTDIAARRSLPDRRYPSDPVAALEVIAPPDIGFETLSLNSPARGNPEEVDRIPLWLLAPGADIFRGSMSNSIGIKLSDFSARNLANSSRGIPTNGRKTITTLDVSPSPIEQRRIPLLPVEGTKTTSAPTKIPPAPDNPEQSAKPLPSAPNIRLTPPDHASPGPPITQIESSGSWSAKKSSAKDWRKRRMERLEDVIDELVPPGNSPREDEGEASDSPSLSAIQLTLQMLS